MYLHTFKMYLLCVFANLIFFSNTVSGQDTIRYFNHIKLNTNPELKSAIELFQKYYNAKEAGSIDYEKFWIGKELEKYVVPDLATHYQLPKKNVAVMGLSIIDSSRYLLKTVGYMSQADSTPSDIMYIYNYIVYKIDGNYKLGNYLDYWIQKENIQHIKGNYGEYYGVDIGKTHQIDTFFGNIADFFKTDFDVSFKLFNFSDNLQSLNARGYDYFVGSLNSKSTVSGIFNPINYIMYTVGGTGIHKHELLRSLHVLLPESPIILRNGLANLIGGSLGLSIQENVRILYPYLKDNPTILNNIENFYYFDDQVVPNAVFTALITNHYINKYGINSLKKIMKSEGERNISIRNFISKYFQTENVSEFFLSEMKEYLQTGSRNTNLF